MKILKTCLIILSLLLTTGISGIQAQSNSPATIAIYHFNKNYTNSFNNSFNAVPYGNTGFTTGPMGYCATFDGQSSYVDTGIDLTNYKQFSISLLFNRAGKASREMLLGQDVQGGRVFTLEYDPNKPLGTQLYSYDGGSTIQPNASTTVKIHNNQWYYVVVTHSSTVYNLYLNGELIASGHGRSYQSSGITLKIGARDYTTARDFFKGKMDDVKIYSSILDSATIKTNYEVYASEIYTFNGNTNTMINPLTQQATGTQATGTNPNNSLTKMLVDTALIVGLCISLSVLFFMYKKKSKLKRKTGQRTEQHAYNSTGRQQQQQLRPTNQYTCVRCHTTIQPEDKYCQNCGAPIFTIR